MSDFTQDFFTSRRNFGDGTTRIGEEGRLWYDSTTNTVRISDGVTPGGIIVLGGGSGAGGSGYSGFSGYSGWSGFSGIDGLAGESGYSGFSGIGLSPWQKHVSNYYAVNGDRIIADTGGGSFTIYLPSSPSLGDYVQITDGNDFYTNHLLVNPNGGTIEGYTQDICLDLRGVTFEFIYSGTTWQVTGTTGAKGETGFSGNSGFSGFSGYSGWSGFSGQSITLQGTVIDYTELPSYAPAGTLLVVLNSGGGFSANTSAISDGAEPVSTWTDIGPVEGPSGYSGYSGADGASGASGYSGLDGATGASGYSGFSGDSTSGYSGFSGIAGVDGISGYSGFSGADGASGYSGYSGLDGQSNLIWSESGIYRTLTQYRNEDDTVSTIRVAEFSNNLLRLTLASFTPTLTTTITPAPPPLPAPQTLNWDVPVTAFTVIVANPDDIPNEYITDVSYITTLTGFISNLADFSAGAKSAIPGPGVDWNQTFSTGVAGYIRSSSNTIAGGTATANVFFKYWNGSTETNFLAGSASLSVTWSTPTITLTLGALTGSTFLQTYNSTTYTLVVTGMASAANYSNNLTGNGGTVSNPAGNGTFTFTDPIHKNNTSTSRTVSNTTTFTRPATVTGTSYTATLSSTTPNAAATFTYPSLWVFTPSTFDIPTRSSYISGSGFAAGVTVLGNQVKVINGYINNPTTEPKGFWFAVRTSASQPTSFKTGASPSLLSDVTAVTGNTVLLSPDVIPSGYVAESYTLYGITLQAGSTYVSIS